MVTETVGRDLQVLKEVLRVVEQKMSEVIKCDVVELDYNDLAAGVDLSAEIEKAYGFEGAGLLTVRNVPNYVAARKRLLPLYSKFADLPNDVKDK